MLFSLGRRLGPKGFFIKMLKNIQGNFLVGADIQAASGVLLPITWCCESRSRFGHNYGSQVEWMLLGENWTPIKGAVIDYVEGSNHYELKLANNNLRGDCR